MIDGDIVAWRAAFLTEGNGGSVHDLRELIAGIISEWCRNAKCAEYIVCLSIHGKPNFRHSLYKKYKGNRKGRAVPKFLKTAYEIIPELHPSITAAGFEADDLMGILATDGSYPKPVIVTIDKDLRTVPGVHFNPTKDTKHVRVSPDQAEYNFCYQWLIGDSGDGYPGLPGCGPKRATELLRQADPDNLVRDVQEAYHAAGLSFDACVTQARLAKILTADYRKIHRDKSWEIVLYTPPKAPCWRYKPSGSHKKVH